MIPPTESDVTAFDPYYLWLAIPPDQQPAHYYRLLGLEAFEDDPEVLGNAVDRQITYIRSFLAGEHAEAARALLDELEAVRRCVLNPESKAAYDRALQALLSSPAPAAQAGSLPTAQENMGSLPPPLPPQTAEAGRFPARLMGAVLAAALFVGVVAWGVFFHSPAVPTKLVLNWPAEEREGATLHVDDREMPLSGGSTLEYVCEPGEHRIVARRPGFEPFECLVVVGPEPSRALSPVWRATAPRAVPAPAANAPQPEASAVEPSAPEPPPEMPPGPNEVAQETPSLPVPAIPSPPPTLETPSASDNAASEAESPPKTEPPPAPEPSTPPPEPVKKAAVPSLARQEEIRRQLEQVYHPGEAKKRFEKIKLARKLVALTSKTEGNSDEQYVLLKTASTLAAEGGEASVMFEALDALGSRFDLDLLQIKVDALCQFADEALEDVHFRELMRHGARVTRKALARERFEAASQLADAVYRNCLKSAGKTYRKEAHDRRGLVQEAQKRFREMKPFFEALKADPKDREAHLALGCWYCFEKDRWGQGLRHLAQGNDEGLRTLAQRELDSPPREPKQQVALGDAWWELAEKTDDAPKEPLQKRASHWYRQALPRLQGLSKVKVEKRLAEFRLATQSKTPPKPPPRIKPKSDDNPRKATLRGTIHACCDDDFILCVNGEEVLRGGLHRVARQSFQFARGDVITVRATDVGGEKGFACVIKTETGGGIVSGPAWKTYRPRSPEQWAQREQIDRVSPVVPGDAKQTVSRLQRATGVAAPCIWGNGNPCYLVVFVR